MSPLIVTEQVVWRCLDAKRQSNCSDAQLGGTLYDRHDRVLANASNTCSPPQEHSVPWRSSTRLVSCPRMLRDRTAGKAWELCRTIHCEVSLLQNLLPEILQRPLFLQLGSADRLETPKGRAAFLSLFTPQERESARDGTIVVAGIDWMCRSCQEVLFVDFAVRTAILVPSSGRDPIVLERDFILTEGMHE